MNPARFCTPCQWNHQQVPATWAATNKEDGLALFLCDACKAGYNIQYTAITIEAFWERIASWAALKALGLPRPRCKKEFKGGTCEGVLVGQPTRCTRCGGYGDNFDTLQWKGTA